MASPSLPDSSPDRRLLSCIKACKAAWKEDRAYKDVLFNLRKVEEELDLLTASPGHRAAMRATEVNAAGQEPMDRSEAPSEVQK